MTTHHLTETTFNDFDLHPDIIQGIDKAGFSRCTPIQAETLPIALGGQDVSGQAQTGTGKTAAFLVALLQKLLGPASEPESAADPSDPNPKAIVIAPTRELAQQIFNDAKLLGQFTGLRMTVVYGGTGYEQQRQSLVDGIDILIGTPGRLIDYYKQHVYNLKSIKVMVLDEADRMFDLGFIKDIRYMLRRMPPPSERLSMLFSATLSYRVSELSYEHMNNAVRIEVEPEKVTSDQIKQFICYPANNEKISLLVNIFNTRHIQRAIVFCNTKRDTETVAAYLAGNDKKVALLSGDVPQKKRLSLLQKFTAGELNVMVATDVAARGLHIPAVSHIINYDLPQDAEDYVHRIGRTARAGAQGEAISFACENSVFSLPAIEEYIGLKIPLMAIDPELLQAPKPPIFPKRAPQKYNKSGQRQNKRPHKPSGQRHHKPR